MTTIKFRDINPHTMPEPPLEHQDYYPIQLKPYVDDHGNIAVRMPRVVCNNSQSIRRVPMAHTPTPDRDDVMLTKVLYELEANAIKDWAEVPTYEIASEFAFIAKMIHDYRSDNL